MIVTLIKSESVLFVFLLRLSFDIISAQNYEAKISGFGLARLGPSQGNSHVTTRVMGTYGYAAPEYMATGI